MTTKVSVVNKHSTSFMGGISDISPFFTISGCPISKNILFYVGIHMSYFNLFHNCTPKLGLAARG
jgi:hypothetical protein